MNNLDSLFERNILIFTIIAIIFITILFFMAGNITANKYDTNECNCSYTYDTINIYDSKELINQPSKSIPEEINTVDVNINRYMAILEDEEMLEDEIIPIEELGEFTITAYDSDYKCCGEYALNRPLINGKEIVYTASGAIAQSGITIAVDPKIIPYGTVLYIEGVGIRIAQDCGGGVKNQSIDLFMESHDSANQWGRQTLKVWKVNEE